MTQTQAMRLGNKGLNPRATLLAPTDTLAFLFLIQPVFQNVNVYTTYQVICFYEENLVSIFQKTELYNTQL